MSCSHPMLLHGIYGTNALLYEVFYVRNDLNFHAVFHRFSLLHFVHSHNSCSPVGNTAHIIHVTNCITFKLPEASYVEKKLVTVSSFRPILFSSSSSVLHAEPCMYIKPLASSGAAAPSRIHRAAVGLPAICIVTYCTVQVQCGTRSCCRCVWFPRSNSNLKSKLRQRCVSHYYIQYAR